MSAVTLVDLGYGNLGSIEVALRRCGAEVRRSSSPIEITAAERLLLPGVGAAAFAIERIRSLGLTEALCSFARPALGICLGMHLLFQRSDEGEVETLGVIPGNVRRLLPEPGLTVPHMGWSRLSVTSDGAGVASDDYVYFAHSFAADDGPATVATAQHGRPIPAIVQQENWTGAQFHPERSGPVGRRFLEAWLAR